MRAVFLFAIVTKLSRISGRNIANKVRMKRLLDQIAAVWQGLLDRVEERNGHKLPIDVSVAATSSPSLVAAD